jgi:hypothetical protein
LIETEPWYHGILATQSAIIALWIGAAFAALGLKISSGEEETSDDHVGRSRKKVEGER